MKKAIVSPLCSALVIPGLGQVLNQHLLKGGMILAGVFALFTAFVIRLYLVLVHILDAGGPLPADSQSLSARLKEEDLTLLWISAGLFALLWLYSVLDALWFGRKLDLETEEKRP